MSEVASSTELISPVVIEIAMAVISNERVALLLPEYKQLIKGQLTQFILK